MDAAYARLNRTSADFWDRRAKTFHEATRQGAEKDLFFQRVRRFVGPRTTVLDVGAGTGRFALALAPYAARVTAVDPSAAMLRFLKEEALARKVHNVDVVEARWEDAEVEPADVVICSHVLYPIRDIVPFVRKLDAHARRACFVYMRGVHIDAVAGHLWQHFHGEPRKTGPSYIHLVDVLFEMGIFANVETTLSRSSWVYDSLDDATDQFMEMLILPDRPEVRRELRGLLAGWLVEREGRLGLPVAGFPTAIIWWRTGPGRIAVPPVQTDNREGP